MKSMTGYGQGFAQSVVGRVTIELRTVNGRFLDLQFRLGHVLATFESEARRVLMGGISRGKVSVHARFDAGEKAPAGTTINRAMLDLLVEEARDRVGLIDKYHQAVRPEILMLVPGVVQAAADPEFEEQLRELFEEAMNAAVASLSKDREREGAALAAAMLEIHSVLETNSKAIAESRDAVVAQYREKLKNRIEELLPAGSPPLDPGRLEQEVILFADKADISEECTRLIAHLAELKTILTARGNAPVGRRLDFLAQEIGREINTTGSKAKDLEMIQGVMVMKRELESLREQLANIE